jgi:hypothetical protein
MFTGNHIAEGQTPEPVKEGCFICGERISPLNDAELCKYCEAQEHPNSNKNIDKFIAKYGHDVEFDPSKL